MHYKNYFFISSICLILGLFAFAIHREWIIFNLPQLAEQTSPIQKIATPALKKKVTLYFWHNNWHHETTELVWPEQKEQALLVLLSSWLTMLEEEHIIPFKAAIQSILVSPNDIAYLSFDHTPFAKESITHEKLMILEGLLKTIKENNIKLQGIQFLVRHQPLVDTHLDFSKPWPLTGFLS